MKDLDPMQEAYKLLDGEPASDAVSVAAKGGKPRTAYNENEESEDNSVKRFEGNVRCRDINDAYAMLFESLAVIMKAK